MSRLNRFGYVNFVTFFINFPFVIFIQKFFFLHMHMLLTIKANDAIVNEDAIIVSLRIYSE